MTYLELCQSFVREVGLASTGPSAVTSQTGQMLRVVNWIKDAWTEIQTMRDDWRFMWITDSFNTLADGTATYDRTTASPYLFRPDKETFAIYLAATGTSARQALNWEDYGTFRESKLRAPASDAKPAKVTQRPDNSLEIWPGPNAVYTIEYEGIRDTQTLAADSDTPLMKSQYHMAIVYHAILLSYARYEENAEAVPSAKVQFGLLYEQMLRTQTLRSDNDEIIVRPSSAFGAL